MFRRSSGVLMHITSLPSPHGIGTMGQSALDLIDFLAKAGQSYWQILPLGHTGFGNSPYQCYSVAAGNPLLIDLDLLQKQGLLTADEIAKADKALGKASPDRVDYTAIEQTRLPLLRTAFTRKDKLDAKAFAAFCKEHASWLPDYALFFAIKQHYGGAPLWEWKDPALLHRDAKTLESYRTKLADEVAFYTFVQFLFFSQWQAVKTYANQKGIQIIGDLPIYVSADSVDVWVHPELFQMSGDLRPKKVAGVPPDYYSETGQLWGNPVYAWKTHAQTDYAWWIWRVQCNLHLFDVLRLDHFRGFEAYWEVPASETTAIRGKWRKGPGMALFRAIEKHCGRLPFIAEDLGVQTDALRALLQKTGYPGMRVLIFGLDDPSDNDHLPHNYPQNAVVYTSTHDSQTVCEQVMDLCSDTGRAFSYAYLRSSMAEALGWSAIKSVFASPARLAMVHMPDLLSLGADARMNVPSTLGDNWCWRVRKEAINDDVATMLLAVTKTYKREG